MNNSSSTSYTTQLHGAQLILARFAWVVLAPTILISFIAALPYRIQELRQDPYEFGTLLTQLGFSIDAFVAYGMAWEFIVIIGCLVMSVVIFLRKSDDWMGLLISGSLMLVLVALPVIPALGNAFPALQVPLVLLRALAIFSIILVCFLFPDGRFVPGWVWVWFSFYVLISPILANLLDASITAAPLDIQSSGEALLMLWLLVGLCSGVIAQLYRFRHVSNPIERQQTKWVMYGFAAVFVGLTVLALPVILLPTALRSAEVRLAYLLITIPISLLAFFAVPFSLGISILRYRLWDIDLIIRRTLVYGALSASLAAIYFISVVILQQIFSGLSGEGSPAAIVISTLTIAALFNPIRKRLQENIDKRFYRRRYDAEKALANFGEAARDEVELNVLTDRLISVLEDTVQPEHIVLWINDPKNKRFTRQKIGEGSNKISGMKR